MIDLHCHLLPEIDDGANDMAQALAMARQSVEDGITHAVLTPHINPGRWDNSRENIARAVADFRGALKDADIPLTVSFAAEVRLSDEIFMLLEQEKLPFLGSLDGYNLLLIEFPPNHIVPGTDKLFSWLLSKKICPVIAHPERNQEIARKPERLKPFLEQGCLAQLTAASLLGRFGSQVTRAAEHFLRENQIHLVASDAHNTSTRAPKMTQARQRVADLAGEERAEQLFLLAPRAIVFGS